MKHIQLKDVMSRLRIVAHETGFEVHNAAGTAKYNNCGYRIEVNGIPEYFPTMLVVERKDQDSAGCTINDGKMTMYDGSGRKACAVGPLSAEKEKKVDTINVELKLDTTEAQKKLDELQKAITGSKAFEALSGGAFLNEACIKLGAVEAGITLGIENNFEAIINNALAGQAEYERIKTALSDHVSQAAREAVTAIRRDFQNRGPLRRTLGI